MVAKSDGGPNGLLRRSSLNRSGSSGSCNSWCSTIDATAAAAAPHNMVESVHEKNLAIAGAYDAGRRRLIPMLAEVLLSLSLADEDGNDDGDDDEASSSSSPSSPPLMSSSPSSSSSPWVCSSDLFNGETLARSGVPGLSVPKFSTRVWQQQPTGAAEPHGWVVVVGGAAAPSSSTPVEVYFAGREGGCKDGGGPGSDTTNADAATESSVVVPAEPATATAAAAMDRFLLRRKFSDGFYYYRACQGPGPERRSQRMPQQRDDDDSGRPPEWVREMAGASAADDRPRASASTASAKLARDMGRVLEAALAGVVAAEALKVGTVPRNTVIRWKEQLATYLYI